MLAVLSTDGGFMNREAYLADVYVPELKKDAQALVFVLNDDSCWHAGIRQDHGGRVRLHLHAKEGHALLCTHERRYDLSVFSFSGLVLAFYHACLYAACEPARYVKIRRNLGPWTVHAIWY